MIEFPSLSSLGLSNSEPISINIITPDLLGPVKNGGIGTACTYLAYALAEAGHKVQILFTGGGALDNGDWTARYEKTGINVIILQIPKKTRYFPDHPPVAISMSVYEWLAAHPHFDMAIFMEWQGNGFYAMHAKKCGLHFKSSTFVVVIHSPSIWHSLNNATPPYNPIVACTWHMERACVEMADIAISPSQYMLNWCHEHGYQLPDRCFVQPNLLAWSPQKSTLSEEPIVEVVFFGRLEYRKGLDQFCSALDILSQRHALPVKVTFMGKCSWLGREHSALYIARRSKGWKKCRIGLITNFDHDLAMNYLTRPGRMAIMPSVADNSPYTVYECIMAKIPFLARDVGGIAELLVAADRKKLLFNDNPRCLADKIQSAVNHKPYFASPAFDCSENIRAWTEILPGLAESVNASAKSVDEPLISICVTHYNRPKMLRKCIHSLLEQDYNNYEVILVDDGSNNPEALRYLKKVESTFKQRNWKVIRQKNGYVGRARNKAAEMAQGDWLLFFDDDNVAMPNMLSVFAKAAANVHTGLVTASFKVFESSGEPDKNNIAEQFLPLGNILSYSIIQNAIGDTSSLINRKSFESLGGFSMDYGLGNEDFELFLRFILSNQKVSIIPDPLYWYRRLPGKTSVNADTNGFANRMRSMRPFMEMLPAPLGDLAFLAHGMAENEDYYHELEDITGDKGGLDFWRDAHNETILSRVCELLDEKGYAQLTDQLGLSIQNENSPTVFQLLELMDNKHNKSHTELGNIVDDLENLLSQMEPSDAERHKRWFCLRGLKRLENADKGGNVKRRLVNILAEVASEDITANLGVALYGDDINLVMVHFFRGLVHAENRYMEMRPDVADAVGKGNFICALHHFQLHGEQDKMNWPEHSLFAAVLRKHPDFAQILEKLHMKVYHYENHELSKKLISCLRRE